MGPVDANRPKRDHREIVRLFEHAIAAARRRRRWRLGVALLAVALLAALAALGVTPFGR